VKLCLKPTGDDSSASEPRLQSSGGVVTFLRQAGGQLVPSPAVFGEITDTFRQRLRAWCEHRELRWIEFRKRERKDKLAVRVTKLFAETPVLYHTDPVASDSAHEDR
jgi:DNA primase